RWKAADANATGDRARARELQRAAAELRCVPTRVQRRTTARALASGNAGVAVSRLRAAISRTTATARVPGPLPREEDHDRRHVPLPHPALVPCQCDGRSTHRLG